MNLSTQLNETQHRIVTELDHNILLQAPAGTGKTAILAHRIALIFWLADGPGKKKFSA